jgi:hypothetical protein
MTMTRLNDEIRELNEVELDSIAGGSGLDTVKTTIAEGLDTLSGLLGGVKALDKIATALDPFVQQH